jgi:hypothetical protein
VPQQSIDELRTALSGDETKDLRFLRAVIRLETSFVDQRKDGSFQEQTPQLMRNLVAVAERLGYKLAM